MDSMDEVDQLDSDETEQLRQLIMQQLVSVESSDLSDEESYQIRLSCILEDDETEDSFASEINRKLSFPKNEVTTGKGSERDKSENSENSVPVEEDPPASLPALPGQVSDNIPKSDSSADVQVTDLDELSLKNFERLESTVEEILENDVKSDSLFGFGIKKLKSSDDLIKRPFLEKRTEFSSDSSDLDISVSNSNEPEGNSKSSEVKIVETEVAEDDTLSTTPDNVYIDYETSLDEPKDRTFVIEEKKTAVPDEEKSIACSVGAENKSHAGSMSEESISIMECEDKSSLHKRSLQDVHIRGVSSKEYNPRVPPETYLWEEVKRMREKGGYPWTYLCKPPLDDVSCKNNADHEYEPINPPPLPQGGNGQQQDEQDKTQNAENIIPENEKHFVRIPLDNELIVQEYDDEDVAMADEARSPEDMEVERIAAAQELQDQLENRYLAPTPTTTASQSRTDCDVNTSMLDSSGLEDLPLNRGSRNKKAIQSKSEQMRAQAHGIHQKLRSQAGKLRNKLRNIPKPSFNLKDRQKTSSPGEEKPKTQTSERPKFSLPERAKFKLPERPKFNLPERPKINLPSFGKSKANRDRQQATHSTAGTKKNIFEFDFKPYPKIFSKKSRQRGDYLTSSPKQTRGNTPPPTMRSEEPKLPERRKLPAGQKWGNRFDDVKYVDDEMPNSEDGREIDSRKSEKSESLSDFRDKDLNYIEDLETNRLPPGRRTVSTKSSLSHLSDREVQSSGSSEDRLRKGVLEEIDSDEFFLRQKGISQEDIDMGKYLTEEIREAFRSPVKNALAQLDYDYDDMEIENIDPKTQVQPNRPDRLRSLRKKSTTSKTSETEIDENLRYRTYPPSRPQRKRSQSKSMLNEEGVIAEAKPRYENDVLVEKPRYANDFSVQQTRYENIPYADDNMSDYYKSPGSVKEYEHYKVPRKAATVAQPTPMKRKSSSKDKISNKKKNEGWVEVEIETSVEEFKDDQPPQPLTRRKSRKGLDRKQESTEEWIEEANAQVAENKITVEPDYIIPASPDDLETPPLPPKRTRTLSRGSKSLRSLKMENEAGKKTEVEEEQKEIKPDIEERLHTEVATAEPPKAVAEEIVPDDDASYGYATVEKTSTLERPERHKNVKPPRPPPPRKKKDPSYPTFNTLPRRMPVRPLRNYSTLGPSRPPRREKTRSVEHIYTEDRQSQAYFEINDPDKPVKTDDNKDLQTEEVIEKMKGRPLPPPPRPPRQKSRGPDDVEVDVKDEEKIALGALTGEAYPIETQVEAFVHEPPPGVEIVEEVTVSTQTDPLPEDFCLEGEEEADVIQEFSHEQLRIQEAFLEEMKKEDERLQKEMQYRRGKVDIEHSEVIKQLEEIMAEERGIFEERLKTEADERQHQKEIKELNEQKKIAEETRFDEEDRRLQEEESRRAREAEANSQKLLAERRQQEDDSAQPKKLPRLDVAETDLGYASLDRREKRSDTEPIPVASSTGAISRTQPKPIPVLPQAQVQSQSQPQPQSQSQSQSQYQHQPPLETQIQIQPPLAQPPIPSPPAPISVPVYVPVLPDPNTVVDILKTEKLIVRELDVEKLRVHELQAEHIQVNNLQSARLNIEDINSRTGNLAIGNIELPAEFIRQILARIPWEELRPPQDQSIGLPLAPTPASTPVDTTVPNFPAVNVSIPQMRPPRRHHGAKLTDSEEDDSLPSLSPRRTYRRHHSSRQHSKHSSGDEDEEERRDVVLRRHPSRGGMQSTSIPDLAKQLFRACTSAGARTVGNISAQVRAHLQCEEKTRHYQTVLCIILVLIAGFFLLGLDSKGVHHYHWDFQFPPQPPKQT